MRAPLLPRPPTQNVDYGACASVSWPCMCVSARFEGLLQRVCVSQQSSCSSSHGPPFSPLASPPFTALASRESAQSTPPASPGKTHASGDYDRTYNTARGLRLAYSCGPCGGVRRSGYAWDASMKINFREAAMNSIDDNIHADTLSSKDALRIIHRLAAHWAPRQL